MSVVFFFILWNIPYTGKYLKIIVDIINIYLTKFWDIYNSNGIEGLINIFNSIFTEYYNNISIKIKDWLISIINYIKKITSITILSRCSSFNWWRCER